MTTVANQTIVNSTIQRTEQTSSSTSLGGGFEVDDFFQLIAAQLKNQDMMNPVDDTQFLAQLAQITSLEVMNSMSDTTTVNYTLSLVGKEVTVAGYDANGIMFTESGVVERVDLFNGTPEIIVNGKSYTSGQIMQVFPEKQQTTTPDTDTDTDVETTPETDLEN